MHIYFSGLGGVAIGPLAEIADGAGYQVSGSDLADNLMTDQLKSRGVDVKIGQDGSQIAEVHAKSPIGWLVYTAALPTDHPELEFARKHNIRISKRDEFLAELIELKNLKLIAVAGTHGKTTTTGLLIWTLQQLGIPISYSVGTTISFGPSGQFESKSEYFIYECDEFDRNMLHFQPHLSLITSLDYDHPDTYPSEADYRQAFVDFLEQSDYSLLWEKDLRYLKADPRADLEAYDELMDLSRIKLAGDHVRHNAYLVERAVEKLAAEVALVSKDSAFPAVGRQDRFTLASPGPNEANATSAAVSSAINSFPGTTRRMEKLADNLYSDYGHHPVEIAATLQLARELSDHVVLVYQPHQNIRQHEVRDEYVDCMMLADDIYWLPTYLSREDPALEVLSPQQLTAKLTNRDKVHIADLNDRLWNSIEAMRRDGKLVLVMGAGSVDGWLRQQLG